MSNNTQLPSTKEHKYIITRCTVADGDALAANNLPAFWADPHFRSNWPNRTLEYHLIQIARRFPNDLLTGRETKRHLKVVHPDTGRIVGYVRWILPADLDAPGSVWPEAVTPAVSKYDEAFFRRLASMADWDTGDTSASDEQMSPVQNAENEILSKKSYIQLDYLAVHPDHQGKGIATQLVTTGLKEAKKIGLDVYVTAFPPGIGLYPRLGFRIEKEVVLDDEGGLGEVYRALTTYAIAGPPEKIKCGVVLLVASGNTGVDPLRLFLGQPAVRPVRSDTLWPNIVDGLAKEQPEEVYGLWPVATDSYDEGFHAITYGQLANIVNGLAWWIVEQLGPGAAKEGDVLTYIGLNDVRLTAMILASVKAGYTLFPTSPRNNPAAQKSLFETLKCRTLVTTDPTLPAVLPILEVVKPRCLTTPSIDELLAEHPPFLYDKHFDVGRWDPLVIWHSSGSTGLPKPLMFTQDAAMRHHACARQEIPTLGTHPDIQTYQDASSVEHLVGGKRMMVTVPPFHGAGILMYMLWAIPAGCIPIAPAAVGIVTAHGLIEALKHTPAEVAVLVPSVVADLAQNPEQLAICAKHLSLILYIGGDLPQAIGDIVAQQIPLRCWWGASEVGIPHQLIPTSLGPSDWRYIRFHPSVGAVFDPVVDSTYELVIRQDKALSGTQSTFSIRGQEELQEYRTKDLFRSHPTVRDAWCWQSRADDIIVFLNGEKTNPIGMEQHVVAQHSELGGALVVGAQRFQAALLIESTNLKNPLTTSEQAALIEKAWPTVQEANAVEPAHARIEKALILVVDRPMIRSGKGTIQRASSVQQYSASIEALYLNADATADGEDMQGEGAWSSMDSTAVSRLIGECACSVIGRPIPDESSFFDYGMDSLMALQILRRLRRGFQRPDLALSTIYSNPSVAQLSAAITAHQNDTGAGFDGRFIEHMFNEYRRFIKQIPKPRVIGSGYKDAPSTVILTGSTGTVGTFLLRALLNRPGTEHVFCLNRAADGGRGTQKLRMAERGLDVDDLDGRVTFLKADLGRRHFGMDDDTYEQLRARPGLVIIHNAWPVNFNLGLMAFRPQLAGLVNLLNLAAEASSADTERPASFVVISSVSAVGTEGHAGGNQPAPERVLSMRDAPQTNGYARSKFLSELLCETAASELRIPITIARVGQVAGAVRQPGGEWNRNEWLPSLVLGSVSMRCLPEDLGPQFSQIDWLPVDILAIVLVELVSGRTKLNLGDIGSARVYNLRNPKTTTWTQLLPAVIDAVKTTLGPAYAPEVVPPAVWLKWLDDEASKETDDGAVVNPAVKLLEFYRDYLWRTSEHGAGSKIPPMSIEQACAHSSTLRGAHAISSQWMQRWVLEWMK